MASPLSEMQIGSPLPDSKVTIAKQLIDGQIEFMDNLLCLHNQSDVVLRNTRSLGMNMLNGSWTYTPQYTYENKHPISYCLGHTQNGADSGYESLMRSLTQKAEQEFYYGPLALVRKFLIQHNSESGRTNLVLPDDWTVRIDDNLNMRDFMGVIEGYVNSDQRQEIASVVFERYYATGVNTRDLPVRLLFSEGRLTLIDTERQVVGADMLFNLTSIIRFISNPYGHGLTQEIFRAYRKLVNL